MACQFKSVNIKKIIIKKISPAPRLAVLRWWCSPVGCEERPPPAPGGEGRRPLRATAAHRNNRAPVISADIRISSAPGIDNNNNDNNINNNNNNNNINNNGKTARPCYQHAYLDQQGSWYQINQSNFYYISTQENTIELLNTTYWWYFLIILI